MKEKSLNSDLQKDSDQSNQKSSKKEKKKFLKKYLRSIRNNLKTECRKSNKRNNFLLANSQIIQVKIHEFVYENNILYLSRQFLKEISLLNL